MCINIEIRDKCIVKVTLNADNTNKLIVHIIIVDIPCTPKHCTKKQHVMITSFGTLIFVISPLYCHLCIFVTFYNTHLHVHKYTYTYIYIYIFLHGTTRI